MQIELFTTGGTIDKIYFDALSEFSIGEPQAVHLMCQAGVAADINHTALLRKDSLEISAADREMITERVAASPAEQIIITHGTDTMAETGRYLSSIKNKTIVLVGAMQPAAMRDSDASFNLGFALAAVQLAPAGIYIAMNGQLLEATSAVKDRQKMCFKAG